VRAELPPSSVVVVGDTREQHLLDVAPLPIVRGTLQTGDYGLRDLPLAAAIERKSLGDLLCCVGGERERFERELERLLAFPCRALLIESDWPEIERGEWRSKLTPKQVRGSLLGWQEMGVPLLLAGNHERAGRFVAELLYRCASRRYRELRKLLAVEGDA
jgi:ERCC4-type nuclease